MVGSIPQVNSAVFDVWFGALSRVFVITQYIKERSEVCPELISVAHILAPDMRELVNEREQDDVVVMDSSL